MGKVPYEAKIMLIGETLVTMKCSVSEAGERVVSTTSRVMRAPDTKIMLSCGKLVTEQHYVGADDTCVMESTTKMIMPSCGAL